MKILFAIALLFAACDLDEGVPYGDDQQARAVAVPLGMVTGGIYQVGPDSAVAQGLDTHAPQVMCELASLGVRWIRIEAPWYDTRPETYRAIVDAAHDRGIQVVVMVPDQVSGVTCVNDPARTAELVSGYVAALDALATDVFAGHEPDAWEITNEPNAECAPGQFRVGGRALAALLRAVWSWKEERGRSELVISGGILNAHHDGCARRENGTCVDGDAIWWDAFLAAPELVSGPRPFDHFGIHPYHPFAYAEADLSRPCAPDDPPEVCNGFPQWKAFTRRQLTSLKARLDQTLGGDTRLFATEFGWQQCSGDFMCAPEERLVAEGMRAAAESFEESGVVDAALWYSYRDDPPEAPDEPSATFGIRRLWNGSRHPTRLEVVERLRALAGGRPEECWPDHARETGIGVDAADGYHPAMAECYGRHGGAHALGAPFDNGGGAYVHGWGAGLVQDLRGGALGDAICTLRDGGERAFLVRGDIRVAYFGREGGAGGALGFPVDDEHEDPALGLCQPFEGGMIAWDHGLGGFRAYAGGGCRR